MRLRRNCTIGPAAKLAFDLSKERDFAGVVQVSMLRVLAKRGPAKCRINKTFTIHSTQPRPEPRTYSVMETSPTDWICSICELVLHPTVQVNRHVAGPNGFVAVDTAQTNQVYLEAVQNGCLLCSLIHCLANREQSDGQQDRFDAPFSFFLPHLAYRGQHKPISAVLDDSQPVNLWVRSSPRPDARTRHVCVSFTKAPQDCILVPPASLGLSTGSESTLETIHRWLESCSASHDACNRRRSADGWRPTRLMDLGEPGAETWRLCTEQEHDIKAGVGAGPGPGASSRYMTLSYRWARDPSLTLTRKDLATFRTGQPIIDLPLLFRQFIAVVRHLGFRYLWIDALCIVQDWTEDWEREAAMMHKVYSNSACNIAASAAEGPHQSLFRDRDHSQIAAGFVDASLFSGNSSSQRYVISERDYYQLQLRGPLNDRGWVMQERFLAPRVLYFGTHQVLWDCLTEHKSEVFPQRQPGPSPVKNISALWDFIGPRPAPGMASMSDALLAAWTRVINEYARCQLTYPTDKMFAIAGIAQVFAEASGDVFVAGMWMTRIAHMLDWRVERPAPRRSKLAAPTFSWASVESGQISFPKPGYRVLVEVLEVTIPPNGQSCFLKARGRMFTASENPEESPDEPKYYLTPLLQSGPDNGSIVPALVMWQVGWDMDFDMWPVDQLSVVVSGRMAKSDGLRAVVLVKSGLEEYRRVGSAILDCDGRQFEQLLACKPTDFTWV